MLERMIRRKASMFLTLLMWAPVIFAATPQDDVRSFFEHFVAAQNAHDLDTVQTMLWDSPDFLWISRGTQVRGSSDALATYRSYYTGTWHLDADMTKFQTIVLSSDVVELFVPVTFSRGAPGQLPQSATFLISQTLIHNATGWHVATIIPIANTQLK